MVCMSTVPDSPWPIRLADGVRCTTTLLNQLAGYWSNCTSRLLDVDTCWAPLINAVEKSGPRPWMVSTCGRPLTRCMASPAMRPRVSAMLTPGSLPICSADTASTMELELRLSAVEFLMLLMKPVTSMVCSSFAWRCGADASLAAFASASSWPVADWLCAWSPVVAYACAGCAQAPPAATSRDEARAAASRLRLRIMIRDLPNEIANLCLLEHRRVRCAGAGMSAATVRPRRDSDVSHAATARADHAYVFMPPTRLRRA